MCHFGQYQQFLNIIISCVSEDDTMCTCTLSGYTTTPQPIGDSKWNSFTLWSYLMSGGPWWLLLNRHSQFVKYACKWFYHVTFCVDQSAFANPNGCQLDKALADLGVIRDMCPPPPSGPKFLHFHAVFGENWPNNRLAHSPLGLAHVSLGLMHPPLGNPGSTTVKVKVIISFWWPIRIFKWKVQVNQNSS